MCFFPFVATKYQLITLVLTTLIFMRMWVVEETLTLEVQSLNGVPGIVDLEKLPLFDDNSFSGDFGFLADIGCWHNSGC